MTARYILAVDQGTTSTRSILSTSRRGWSPSASSSIISTTPTGLGRARRVGDLAQPVPADPGDAARRRDRAGQPRRRRHRQPARDDGRLGPPYRKAGAPGDCVAGHPDLGLPLIPCGQGRVGTGHRRTPAGAPTSAPLGCAGSSTTCRWPREHAEDSQLLFGTMETWLIWNLTGGTKGGVHVTDVTNASRTMLMNLRTLEWDPYLLELFSIPKAMLPEIRPSMDRYGTCTGVLEGVPLVGALGDQTGSIVRADLLRRRRRQVHLRHRQLCAAQHRRRGDRVQPRAYPDGRVPDLRPGAGLLPSKARSR